MSELPAYCFYKTFEPEPAKEIRFDRHYLLYASKGTLRLRTNDKAWTLPPSRAAWISADTSINIEIPRQFTTCSVLFSTDFIEAPAVECSVFDLTPLAREMILECRQWGPDSPVLTPYAVQIFQTLALTCHELSKTMCNTWIPRGNSEALRRAILFSNERLGEALVYAEVANAAHLSERSLARRFAGETGMTWRQMLRRMRMIRAIELLSEEGTQVTEVALSVGYNSLSAFNAAFKEFTGQSPRQYRNRK